MKKQFFKNSNNVFYRLSWLMLLTFFMGIAVSCDDDDDIIDDDAVPVAYVSLYHVAPDGPALDILVDNKQINYYPFEYTDYTGYLSFYTGERDLKFTPYNADNTLAEETLTLKQDSLYSVFVTGVTGDKEVVVVQDEIEESLVDNALIRVVHVSPDAPAINLSISGVEENLFSDLTYREVSDFAEIEDGLTTFEIVNAETGEVVTTVSDVNFFSNRVYTLVVRGYVTPPVGSEKDLSVQIIPNYYNL